VTERGGPSATGLVQPLGTAEDAAGIAPAWLFDLETAHDGLRRTARLLESMSPPPLDLTPAASLLERVFTSVYDAMDERAERLASVRGAMAAIAAFDGLLRPAVEMDPTIGAVLTEVYETHGVLARAEHRLLALVPNLPAAAPELVASRDTFHLHVLERPSLAPVIRVQPPETQEITQQPPPPLPPPKTFEELAQSIAELKRRAADTSKQIAERVHPKLPEEPPKLPPPPSPPGFTAEIPEVQSEADFVRARAREYFEEITMIGTQRAPLLGDPWRNALGLERRMLNAIDALAAMGSTAIAYLEPLVLDSPAKDPSRAFGIAAALGCIAGRDALAAAERVAWTLRQNDPESLSQLADALKLVPHGSLALALRTLIIDRDPAMRALAIDVLAYRGLASPDDLARAAMDAPAVAAKALPYAALAKSPVLNDAVAQALASGDPAAARGAWLAMAFAGHPQTSFVLGAALAGADAELAALLLALAGDSHDADTLLNAAIASPARPLITALGWAGSATAVAPLMDFLEHSDAAVKLAAAYALERITGAGLWENAPLDLEEILVEDPPEPDMGEPKPVKLAPMVSDPRDLPGEPAPELIQQPTVSGERWRAYWTERGPFYKAGLRYRRGFPYTPLVSLQDLDTGACTPGERRSLQRELCMRTGQAVRLDPIDFVMVQEEALREWLPIAQRMSTKPGQWTRPYR
jgi:hypothetical protein